MVTWACGNRPTEFPAEFVCKGHCIRKELACYGLGSLVEVSLSFRERFANLAFEPSTVGLADLCRLRESDGRSARFVKAKS
jgi:hypothetical protein